MGGNANPNPNPNPIPNPAPNPDLLSCSIRVMGGKYERLMCDPRKWCVT